MTTARSEDLKALAQRVADALPVAVADEVVLTGSVSRGVADDVSDIEMLIVTAEALELEDCFRFAAAAGLEELDTWGTQQGPTRRVSGRREQVPIELIWWPRHHTESQIDLLLAGEMASTADALVYGVPLRTTGRLTRWQDRLRTYPSDLAAAQIEQAALPWGGFAPIGVLTLVRPRDRLALMEWIVDGANRVLTIVFALNRTWRPTTKRLAARVAGLSIKPAQLAERIEQALTEPDARRALRVMTDLQLDTVRLAPSGPNIDRARSWLASAAYALAEESHDRAAPTCPSRAPVARPRRLA
jgi:predicted nucleotidyltransferase